MKHKIWLWQLPVVALFAFAFYVYQAGVEGDLDNNFLRENAFPVLRVAEGWFTNLKFRIRGPEAPKNKIVVVEIDSDSIAQLGRWPWHRNLTAYLVDKVFQAGAKSVGLDMVFSEPDQRVSDELATFLTGHHLGEKIKEFETDHVLANVIDHYSDHLVTGWVSDHTCQPSFEGAQTCPLLEKETVDALPQNFEKFGYASFDAPSFQIVRTPLISAVTVLANIPEYQEVTKHSGFFNTFLDGDGYTRRTNLVMMVNGKPQPSLALEVARVGLGEDLSVTLDDRNKVKSLGFRKSGKSIDVTPIGAMEIIFRGPSYTFQYVRASELLTDQDEIHIERNRKVAMASKSELLKDAYVFIGISAVGVFDMRAFPFDSSAPGVEGHANILDNILSNDMLHQPGPWGNLAMLLFMTIGALLFAYTTERLESIPALITAITVFSGLGIADVKILFAQHHVNLNTSLLFFELAALFMFTLGVKYVMEERNKKFIKGAFAKYVAPAIIDSIMKDPTKLSVGGVRRDLTILFSDIRGFTTFSEQLDPKQLAQFLNDYSGIMTNIVFDNDGTLDKYIGDAVMAFWGAPLDQPKHAANSARAAVKMMQALHEHRPRFKSQYGVTVDIGIGINSGAVTVGNMGSDRIFEYTVIGDHVNLASRLEGLTKFYGVAIITSRFTFDSIRESGEPAPAHRVLDLVKVKGKKTAVELIQILDRDLPQPGLAVFEEARLLYQKGQWDQALAKFTEANALLKADGEEWDGPCEVYVERCKLFKQTPPNADWDGSWEMTSK